MLNVVMLNVIMLNVVMLNVVMLNVIVLNVIMLNVIMLNVIILDVVMLNVIKLNVITLNVFMLNVIMLSVVASLNHVLLLFKQKQKPSRMVENTIESKISKRWAFNDQKLKKKWSDVGGVRGLSEVKWGRGGRGIRLS
jgi:hypothetical protein